MPDAIERETLISLIRQADDAMFRMRRAMRTLRMPPEMAAQARDIHDETILVAHKMLSLELSLETQSDA